MTTPSKEKLSQNQSYPPRKKSKYLALSNIVVILIAIIPFLFYINDIFPDGAIWENSFFTYQSKYYESVNVFIWVVLGKLIPLLLFIIWFFTCKHWWYPVILIPISLYSFQLVFIILEDSEQIDSDHFYYLIPVVIIILCTVYSMRTKIFDKIHGIDLSELNSLNKSNKKSWWNRFR
ncbi:hypothetical protein D1815_04290 [Aquimarina sp. AD1]|uniref:hypothetical protein n=1 Tax=Aquimarina sp. (strain AD1) TaxID=1714848 RepID=UPI000E5093A8|nr:hypothetical protein [Aquimarina sp. AD1]AXT58613.1 hypothetical protein D1815_04290 [Aquimarina sp. AD1]